MSEKDTAFYRASQQVSVDFSAEPISSAIRRPTASRATSVLRSRRLVKQRVYGLMADYPDANDAEHMAHGRRSCIPGHPRQAAGLETV